MPYNPFGQPDNSAAVAYFARDVHRRIPSSISSSSRASSPATSSQLFELPGGPVRFALGAEYRREKAFYQQDQFVTDGFTNGVSIPTFEPDTFDVKEAFAELQIPLFGTCPSSTS